jgi:PAS domain S-box-containing protein
MAPANRKGKGKKGEVPSKNRSGGVIGGGKEPLDSTPIPPGMKGQTPEQLIQELQIHQIELETQGEELRRIQRELEKSRYQYIDLYEFAPVGYLSLNEKTIVTKANLTAATLLGVERSTLIDHGFGLYIVSEDLRKWDQYVIAIMGSGEKQTITIMMRRGDGSTFPARLESTKITYPDGSSVIHITINDISDIIEVMEILKSKESMIRALMDSPVDSIVLIDRNGIIIDVNETLARRHDMTMEQMKGLNVYHLLRPDLAESRRKRIDEVGRTGLVDRFEDIRDGRFYDNSLHPVLDADGNVTHIAIIARDITDIKTKEAQIRKSEEKLQTLYSRLNSAMDVGNLAWWEMECRTGKVCFNERKAGMLGYEPEQFSHYTDFTKLLHPDDYEPTMQAMRDHLAGIKKNYETDYRIRTCTGEYRWFHDIGGISEYDPLGKPSKLIGFVHDITDRKRAEIALNDSLTWLKMVQRAAKAGSWDWDFQTGKLNWSEEFFKLFGLPPDAQPSFDTWLAVLHPDDRAPALETIEKSVKDHVDLWNEYRIIQSDGAVRWIGASGSTTYDPTGRPGRMSGICLDITDQKKMQKALVESEERFHGLFDTINSGVAIYEVRNEGKSGKDYILKDFNKTALEIEGKKKDEVIGKSLFDLRPTIDEYGLIPVFRKVWETGDPGFFPQKIYIDEKFSNWYENRVFRLQSGEIVAVYDDVTERKQAEEALRESEEKFHIVADFTYDWEFWIAPGGKFIYVSPSCERITGYRPEEFIQDPDLFVAIVHNDDRDRITEHFLHKDHIICENEALEFRIISRSGEERWIGHECQPVYGRNGEYLGNRGSNRDINKRKKVEQIQERLFNDIQQKNIELERFTYTVSHDLKSPIITIKGFLGYLEKDALAGDIARLHEDITRIHTATRKMEEFITSLLELSRIGRIVNPPVIMSLRTLVNNAVETLDTQIREGGVSMIIPDDLPEVYGDPARLQQVMTNLINNAVKFMGDERAPRIEITAYHRGSEVVVCVTDNGIGIAPENIEKIFSIFTKLNPEIPGSGIGLALVRRIVEVHGGMCWVESAGLGSGSTFCFSLPDKKPEGHKFFNNPRQGP